MMAAAAKPVFSPDLLAGNHILISGGCGAIGRKLVIKFVAHGARVTVNDIVGAETAAGIFAADGLSPERVRYLPSACASNEEARQLVTAAESEFGHLHTVLCHAGVVVPKPLLETSAVDWDTTVNINLRAAFLLAKAASLAMRANGVRGHLLFTSSWVARVSWPDLGAYNATKAGLEQLMRSFARELAPYGIRANALAPGIVAAGLAQKQWDTEPAYRARASKAIPLGNLQDPESVADAALFLCSSAASYMTGSTLLVDGGCSLCPLD